MKIKVRVTVILALFALLALSACGNREDEANHSMWTWVSGDKLVNQSGVYGAKGVAAPANKPGSRSYGISWRDGLGNLWLFGGWGYDSAGNVGELNDLWKFDGANWTWVSGDNIWGQNGIYGLKGVANPANKPGSRYSSVSWKDGLGNLWLFGGWGYDSTGNAGELNDLWKFNGSDWTWVSGDNIWGVSGAYGLKGIAAPANIPGSRSGSISWIDTSANLWLFGGFGYDGAGNIGDLNDLWKFDGTNWTWVSGNNVWGQSGVYGIKGVAAPANIPGSRSGSISWIDASGNLWLFGGWGYDGAGNAGELNDLWKFDGTNWTWVSGDNIWGTTGVYGAKGVAAAMNIPGSRSSSISWIDAHANLWLFGGAGFDSVGTHGDLNDLWKFDGTNWTWISGDNVVNQSGLYGTQDVAAETNKPGSRYSPISWIDGVGSLWLFGGSGFDSVGNSDYLNDLWKFRP